MGKKTLLTVIQRLAVVDLLDRGEVGRPSQNREQEDSHTREYYRSPEGKNFVSQLGELEERRTRRGDLHADTTAMITDFQRQTSTLDVSASADIAASSRDVYRLIADYRAGHPRMLPRNFFRNLQVDAGGFGAGTVIHFDMLAFGRTQRLLARITEPNPGRVLAETYPENGAVTTFTVDSLGFGRSRVTIATRLLANSGGRGRIELWMLKRYLRKVYVAELALIANQ